MDLTHRLRRAWQARVAAWVRRRQGDDALPLEIVRRRLYILPTRAGVGLAVLLFFMLIAGLNYGNNLALFATFLMMGFMLVGMHLCHRNLQGLRVVAATTRPGFAGGHGLLELTVDTGGSQTRWAIDGDCATTQARLTQIGGDTSARIELAIATPRRGLQRLERVRLSTDFPFGLFRAWTWLHLPIELLVYPTAAGNKPLPDARDAADSGMALAGPGLDEWSGMRAFRDGDSPRQVIWTAYARELPLMVKEYAGAAAEWLTFDFDRLTELDAEQRLQQLCRWILDAESRSLRYALALPQRQLPADAGSAHRELCLRELALWGQSRSQAA